MRSIPHRPLHDPDTFRISGFMHSREGQPSEVVTNPAALMQVDRTAIFHLADVVGVVRQERTVVEPVNFTVNIQKVSQELADLALLDPTGIEYLANVTGVMSDSEVDGSVQDMQEWHSQGSTEA